MTRPSPSILLLVLAFLAAPLASEAQALAKVPRIGLLISAPANAPSHIENFYRGLRELGYVEGQNLVIERRFADGREDRLPALAAELVQLNVDVLVAAGPAATRAAQRATRTIPIVMGTLDPVEQGLIASLARPGGNITGWSMLSDESGAKQLAMLKEVLPRLSRVAVLSNPSMPGQPLRMRHLAASAKSLGLQLQAYDVASPEALLPAFAAMTQARTEAFFVMPEPAVIDGLRDRIVSLAAQQRLPAIYHWKTIAKAGGLMSYGPSLPDLVHLWAGYVHKILKGANPGDLPVETPRKYELVLNLKTARELGITFPAPLLVLADEVIQ